MEIRELGPGDEALPRRLDRDEPGRARAFYASVGFAEPDERVLEVDGTLEPRSTRIDVSRYIERRRYEGGGDVGVPEAAVSAALEPVACCAPLGAPALSEEEARATAELFRALGDPARVQIVNLIARERGALSPAELQEPLGLSQPTVSHHLKKLTEAGLLEREPRGKRAYFSLKRDAVEKLAAVADLKRACC